MEEDMVKNKPILNIIIKSIIFLLFFAFFHFLHDWVPNSITQVFGGTNESMFQHMKLGFYGYMCVSVLEYVISFKKQNKAGNIIFSRILSTILVPWAIFILWYSVPALIGQAMLSRILELIYSIIIVLIVGIAVGVLEWDLDQIIFSMTSRIFIVILFIILTFLFGAFSYNLPQEGFFVS
jgi:hypothetical protein